MRGSEWGIFFSLYMYVRTYVVHMYVLEYVTLRNVDRNVAARARRCENYNLEKQISGRACGAPGLAELEQSQTVTYGVKQLTSRHLSIPQLYSNPEARVQASGAFRACRSRAATCGVEQ